MKRSLLTSTVFCCAIGAGSTAYALDAATPAALPDLSGASRDVANASTRIGEIVVTAQKRAESIQKVPFSITAVTGKVLQEQRITSVADLATVTSGLNYQIAATGVVPYIRNFGINSGAPGNEPLVTTYVDGVYLPSPSSLVFSLNNIERVEVLKGPQGTLFGRNAAAGAVSIVTRTPSHTPSLDLELGYANYNTYSGNFYGTTGLGENFAVDLSVSGSHQSDGWGHNLFNGSDAYLNHNFNVRSKLLWTPTASTTITLAGDYDSTRADASLLTLPGSQKPPYTNAPVGGFYDTQDVIDQQHTAEQGGASLHIEQDLPWASITSITSGRRLTSHLVQNTTVLPIPYATFDVNLQETTYTQEVNVQSLKDSIIKWIVGFYYYYNDDAYNPFVIEGTFTGQGPNGQIRQHTAQSATSYAGYSQATVPFFEDKAHLTAGVRYTSDIHRLTQAYSQTLTSTGVLTPPSNVVNATPQISQGAFTYKASLDYSFTPEVMAYASYNRGFKSGYYNVASTSGAGQPPIKAEFVDAYEIGIKSRLFDNRVLLNLEGFYYDVSNLQVRSVDPVLGIVDIGNAAAARNKGFDATLEVEVTPQLQVTGNLTYADYKYTSYPNATVFNYTNGVQGTSFFADLKGKQVIFADPWSGNIGARYHTSTAFGEIVANVNWSFHTVAYFDAQNSPEQRRAPYQLLDGSIAWESLDHVWGIDLWGRNLTNEKYYTSLNYALFSGDYTPGAPRTFGATLRYHY